MNKCNKGIHKYQPRYDEEPSGVKIESVRGIIPSDLRSLMIRKVYIKDVCARCGKEIKR